MHKLISAVYQIKLSKYSHVSWAGCDPWAFMVKYDINKERQNSWWADRVSELKL